MSDQKQKSEWPSAMVSISNNAALVIIILLVAQCASDGKVW